MADLAEESRYQGIIQLFKSAWWLEKTEADLIIRPDIYNLQKKQQEPEQSGSLLPLNTVYLIIFTNMFQNSLKITSGL